MTSSDAVAAPALGASGAMPRLRGRTLVAAAAGIWVAQLVMAEPAVLNGLFQSDFGPTSAQLTWLTAVFLLPVTLLELTFGVLGDLFGRKRLLIGGAALMVIGLLIAVLSPGAGTATGTRLAIVWTGQAICGLGAAAIIPTSLAMVAAGTHTAAERSRGLTVWSVALVTGGLVAPVLGGWLAQYTFGSDPHSGWRWAFAACMVFAVISGLLSLRADDSRDPVGRSLDWPGQLTIALALLGLLLAVIQGPTSGWGSALVVGGFAAAGMFLALFIAVELRAKAPLLQLRLLRHRPFAAAALATVLGMFAYLGTGYSTSIRLSAIQGFTPLRASLAFVALNGMAVVLYPVTRRALATINPRWVLGAGLALIAAGDFWLTAVPITDVSVAPVIVPLIIAGSGFALAVSSVAAVTVNTVPRHMIGMASGANSMIRDLGFALAPAVLGAVALSRAASAISSAVAKDPALGRAVAAFYASPEHAPAAQRQTLEAAVGAVKSGPLGANGVPASVPGPGGAPIPLNPLHETAFHALGSAYSVAYLIAGLTALAAALITITLIGGRAHDTGIEEESLA
jgi:MFS family permease